MNPVSIPVDFTNFVISCILLFTGLANQIKRWWSPNSTYSCIFFQVGV